MHKHAEWLLRPSRILLIWGGLLHGVVLILILIIPLPLLLKAVFILAAVVSAANDYSKWKKAGCRKLGCGNECWWLDEQPLERDLEDWQQLGGLLFLRFRGEPTLVIVPDMLERSAYRQLQQFLRFLG